jgi:hypothetical protein
MHEFESDALFDRATGYVSPNPKTPDSSGADLSFVRHLNRRLTNNLITMSRLPLCLKKVEISDLVRHPSLGYRNYLSHNPQPTTHNPANDAHLRSVRHLRPPLTDNPLTMSSLSLCPKKGGISGLVRHWPTFAFTPWQKSTRPRRFRLHAAASDSQPCLALYNERWVFPQPTTHHPT